MCELRVGEVDLHHGRVVWMLWMQKTAEVSQYQEVDDLTTWP